MLKFAAVSLTSSHDSEYEVEAQDLPQSMPLSSLSCVQCSAQGLQNETEGDCKRRRCKMDEIEGITMVMETGKSWKRQKNGKTWKHGNTGRTYIDLVNVLLPSIHHQGIMQRATVKFRMNIKLLETLFTVRGIN